MNLEAAAVIQRWAAMRPIVQAGLTVSCGTKAAEVIRIMAELMNEALAVSDVQVSDYEVRLYLKQQQLDEVRKQFEQSMKTVRDLQDDLRALKAGRQPFAKRSLRELAEVIGEEATYALVEQWGGRVIVVPNTVQSDHQLVAELGMPAALKLVDRYRGDRIYIPFQRHEALNQRDEEIVSLVRCGRSNASLAREFGLTAGRITHILTRLAPELVRQIKR